MDITHYRQTLEQPWGKIFYQILFEQLKHLKNQTILDVGAGFCLTADFLSRTNQVVAIEPQAEMLYHHEQPNITKLLGSLDQLNQLPSAHFDLIICHNVLEYIPLTEHPTYLASFSRLLKPQGKLSIIKHNRAGKVMQEVIFNNHIDTALDLLAGGEYLSPSFNQGQCYDMDALLQTGHFAISHYQGIRTFYALQDNAVKIQPDWLEQLTKMELAVCDQDPYKAISFFHHVWLEHTNKINDQSS